jgi:hypothetical protein
MEIETCVGIYLNVAIFESHSKQHDTGVLVLLHYAVKIKFHCACSGVISALNFLSQKWIRCLNNCLISVV